MSVKLMNKLPLELRQLDDKAFRNKLELFLLKNSFYSLQEFLTRKWTIDDFT